MVCGGVRRSAGEFGELREFAILRHRYTEYLAATHPDFNNDRYAARVIKVGLTGGIGSGKSEVARLLAGHGAVVVDADALAREAVAPGTEGLARVVAEFGADVLDADGSLDRSKLAQIVFADADRLAALNAIVHPFVGRRSAEIAPRRRPTPSWSTTCRCWSRTTSRGSTTSSWSMRAGDPGRPADRATGGCPSRGLARMSRRPAGSSGGGRPTW